MNDSTPDREALTRSFAEAAGRGGKLLSDFVAKKPAATRLFDEFGIAKAFMDLAAKMLQNPHQIATAQINLWWDYMALWQGSLSRMLGQQTKPFIEPSQSDKRFKHDDWQEHFLFDYIKQTYLITARWLHNTVASVEGLSDETARKVSFFTRQYIDAMAPSNFALTNPEVFQEIINTGGQNLVRGLNHLLEDIERGGGQLRISMTDPKAFELGINIATTPGKVIWQTDLMQLIQYDPTTPKVFQRPLLIIPPWINKFYILDLREKNSLIKWCLDQGLTVFVISWVNPDAHYAQKDFEDYMLEGPIAALKGIEAATGEKEVNALRYCLGGTLLAATLAYLQAKPDEPRKKLGLNISSATFMTSLTDFSEPGELEVFLDEDIIASLEKRMNERGYLEGAEMANTFNMMRSNDLIWSFVVNNYLLGRDPFPFDLLHWNCDSTRMPARMHSFYLRNFYLKNLLREPGGITLAGVPINLKVVTIPVYFVSAIEDHIAPWKSTYRGPHLMSGPARFVLGGSGHIAGMINPPAAKKYCYWSSANLPESADEWLASAQHYEGSWWVDWRSWLTPYLGDKVMAREVGKVGPKSKARIIEAAPGSYARLRADANGAGTGLRK